MIEYDAIVNTRAAYANIRQFTTTQSAVVGAAQNGSTVHRDEVYDTPNWAAVRIKDGALGFISYDVARFRPLHDHYPPAAIHTVNCIPCADGFDSPVGHERRGVDVWPRFWRDAAPYARLYFTGTSRQAYHTGADLNWGWRPDDDAGQPVYAPAQGTVIYVGWHSNALGFGSLLVIRHDPLYDPGGPVAYTRYGHMRAIDVTPGQTVRRGERMGEIGGVGGFPAHLHYDVSITRVLEGRPGDWPGMDITRVLRDYVDPRHFTYNNRPGGNE